MPERNGPGLHTSDLDWQRLFGDREYFLTHTAGTDVPEFYRNIAYDALQVEGADTVRTTLQEEFLQTPTLDEFLDVVSRCPNKSAPGPTGATYAMIKAWPAETLKMAYQSLTIMWEDRHIPPWWKWRWLLPVPKKPSPALADLRPLTLVETTRKIWSKLIINRIVKAWDNADILHPAQHGYRTALSTMTAILQYVNAAEEAQELKMPIHRSSWDMSKAFDTVSKNAMMIAWLRLGVPLDIALWLVELDRSGVTVVRTPAARRAWKDMHYQGVRAAVGRYSRNMQPMTPNALLSAILVEAFEAERGTGQGDVTSPLCWTALFDILLKMLDSIDADPFQCRGAAGVLYSAGETAFADDMESTAKTNKGMQQKADVVSAFCIIFELTISPGKLRRYFQDWSKNVTVDELTPMIVHTKGWVAHHVPIEVEGNTPYLGGQFAITPKDSKVMLNDMLDTARRHCNAIQHTSGSAASKLMAVTISTHKKIQYTAKISSYTLAQYRQLDKIFAAFYRKATGNMAGYPTALLHTSTDNGGLGIPRISDLIQSDKLGAVWQGLAKTKKNLWATQGLLERALRMGGSEAGPYGQRILNNYATTDQSWIRSLTEWLEEDGLALIQATPKGITLDSYIEMGASIRQRDRERLATVGMTRLADLYSADNGGVTAGSWYIPKYLNMDYVMPTLPHPSTVVNTYSMHVGQYWELQGNMTDLKK
eukprot:gene29001-35972_t